MPAWYVYIVRCADNTLYTGITTDIRRRLDEHNGMNNRGAKFTRTRRPVALVHMESYPTRSKAYQREWRIKRLSKAEKEVLVANGEIAGNLNTTAPSMK